MLVRFISAYQQVETLTIGELWAIASMLRVVLIENLRRCADRIVSGRAQREEADRLADRLLGSPTRAAEPAERVLAAYASTPLPRALAVQLVQRLRDCDPKITPALQRVEELLQAQGLTAEAVVREELQRQGAANVTVRNIVTSLVQLSALDWSDIVEELCAVDKILGLECDFYTLDFATRNSYRSAIEELARDSAHHETEVAQQVVEAVRRNDARIAAAAEPGYYLIGPGRRQVESALGYRRPLRQRLPRTLKSGGIGAYALIIGMACAAVLGLVGYLLPPMPRWQAAVALALLLLPVSEAVIALINSAITRVIKPTPLPALDLGGVVPEEHRTLVAVPVLLSSGADIEEMLANLESEYLAGARGELYYALLADGQDAETAVTAADAELETAGRAGIAALNARYPAGRAGPRFLWLHRSRQWNPAQQRWMGWERKRGKLHELNRLLRGATDTSFQLDATERAALPADVRYVLVLDADTQLPHGAAEKLIAKMAHPLNQPQFDAASQRVLAGYGILQPRVTPALPGPGGTSLVQSVLSGSPGLDPYAFAVSDLYQDLFAEGSFTGKGLYDIDAFERALAGRIRENSVLSHDLLEGLFARAAVVCDVTVVNRPRTAMTWWPRANIAGRGATGSCCRGCCRGWDCQPRSGGSPASRRWVAGSWSTTSGAAWCRRRPSARWCSAGCCPRRRPWGGRPSCCWPWACRRCCRCSSRCATGRGTSNARANGRRCATTCALRCCAGRSASRCWPTARGGWAMPLCARCCACWSRTGTCWTGPPRPRRAATAAWTCPATPCACAAACSWQA